MSRRRLLGNDTHLPNIHQRMPSESSAIRCTLHQGPHSLDSSARQQKNQSPYPPRPTYHEGKPDGGMFRDHDAGFVGTLTPSTISRFWASDIPAE